MTLSEINKNKKVRILKINEGRKLNSYLNSLGINKGSIVNIIDNNFRGPVRISVNKSTFCLGNGISKKILVEEFMEL